MVEWLEATVVAAILSPKMSRSLTHHSKSRGQAVLDHRIEMPFQDSMNVVNHLMSDRTSELMRMMSGCFRLASVSNEMSLPTCRVLLHMVKMTKQRFKHFS